MGKRGRPAGPPEDVRRGVIRIRVNKAERQIVLSLAQAAGVSMTEFIRSRIGLGPMSGDPPAQHPSSEGGEE